MNTTLMSYINSLNYETIRFDQNNVPNDKKLDFETFGKLLDNLIITCHNENKPLDKVGIDYTVDITVGYQMRYLVNMKTSKKYLIISLEYLNDVTKKQSGLLKKKTSPKNKLILKDLEKDGNLKKTKTKHRKTEEEKLAEAKKANEQETDDIIKSFIQPL